MLKLRTLTPLIIIALYLTSAAAWANNIVSDLAHYSFKFETGQKANLNHILTATPLNSVRLEQILAQSQNYQEFLTNLFRLEPDLKNQHVLLFDTGSIQFASPENPRVLTFGKGSVLAFSEPPNTADRRIEIMEFKPDSGTFEFHEIAFKNGARPEFRKNPTSCLACHGEQPKPLWVPYDFWSNMYGSRIGRVGTSAELSAYLKVTEKTHGVYSQLQYVKPAFGERTAYLRQTELFNQYLSTLNMVRIQHLLKNKYNAQFRPIYNAFMAGLNYCFPNTPPENIESELASYLPEGLQSRFAKTFNEVYEDTQKSRRNLKTYLVDRYNKNFPLPHTELMTMNHDRLKNEEKTASILRYLLTNMGIPMQEFTMGLGENDFFFATASNASVDWLIASSIFDERLFWQQNPQRMNTSDIEWLRMDCQQLKTAAKAPAPEVTSPIWHDHNKPSDQHTALGKCIKCHSSTERSGPYIEFDSTPRLVSWLRNDQGLEQVVDRIHREGRGRMPRGLSLSAQEKAGIEEALKSLLEEH